MPDDTISEGAAVSGFSREVAGDPAAALSEHLLEEVCLRKQTAPPGERATHTLCCQGDGGPVGLCGYRVKGNLPYAEVTTCVVCADLERDEDMCPLFGRCLEAG